MKTTTTGMEEILALESALRGSKDKEARADALNLRLSNERMSLARAKTKAERDLRTVWVAQIEKEIACEVEFFPEVELTDEELLAALRK